MSPLLFTQMKRDLQESYAKLDIGVVRRRSDDGPSSDRRAETGVVRGIIGLYTTVHRPAPARPFCILIEDARYVKVEDMRPEDLDGEGFLDRVEMSFEVRLNLLQRALFTFYKKWFGLQDYVCVVKYRKVDP